ncbi:MAG: hypothetical protein HQL03_14245 [Nitrospirae bacterium]|nr:hypothetical protein [Nitrospirota bacterium]MBF0592493.1 hypothetical protein [Nitrospirota bacterium]
MDGVKGTSSWPARSVLERKRSRVALPSFSLFVYINYGQALGGKDSGSAVEADKDRVVDDKDKGDP